MVLFNCNLKVSKHYSKKNSNRIRRAGKRFFLGKPKELLDETNWIVLNLRQQWHDRATLTENIHAEFKFYFANYYTKKGQMNKKLGDLSNLYQLPEDCLQAAGVIEDDCQIQSHDGSRKLPSMTGYDYLEITLRAFEA